jgi:hypothetical protein
MVGIGGIGKRLDDVTDAVRDYLLYEWYSSSDHQRQLKIRQMALRPPDAEYPEILTELRRYENGHLYWPGGIGNQPHFLLLEFGACKRGRGQALEEIANMENLINGSKPQTAST